MRKVRSVFAPHSPIFGAQKGQRHVDLAEFAGQMWLLSAEYGCFVARKELNVSVGRHCFCVENSCAKLTGKTLVTVVEGISYCPL